MCLWLRLRFVNQIMTRSWHLKNQSWPEPRCLQHKIGAWDKDPMKREKMMSLDTNLWAWTLALGSHRGQGPMFCSSNGWCVVKLVLAHGLNGEQEPLGRVVSGLYRDPWLNPEAMRVDVDDSRAHWMKLTKLSGCFWDCSSLGFARKPDFFQSDGKGREREERKKSLLHSSNSWFSAIDVAKTTVPFKLVYCWFYQEIKSSAYC